MKRKARKHRKKEIELTTSGKFLIALAAGLDLLPLPFESKSHYVRRVYFGHDSYNVYLNLLYRMHKKGWITLERKQKTQIPALTKKGELEALFVKAMLPEQGLWDGKWRMILFDIPEDASADRRKLRRLLKKNGYKQLQKSVYISPYVFNAAAIDYLRETGLNKYIRVFRVDKADNENQLKALFHL